MCAPVTALLCKTFILPLLPVIFFVGFFWFSKHLCPYCPRRKLLLCNSVACSVLHVPQPHDHSSHFEEANKKILFLLSCSSKIPSVFVLWFPLVFQSAISLESHEGGAQLPLSLSAGNSLREKYQKLSSLTSKLYQISFSEGLGPWIFYSAVSLGRWKHWALIDFISESKASNKQPEVQMPI